MVKSFKEEHPLGEAMMVLCRVAPAGMLAGRERGADGKRKKV